MAEFSRIQVTPAEEEDIVIVAGAGEEAPASSQETAFVKEKAVVAEQASVAPRRKKAAYEETTLEDLQRSRMSGMQKAIVALAIAAVAAFIIWYVLLR